MNAQVSPSILSQDEAKAAAARRIQCFWQRGRHIQRRKTAQKQRRRRWTDIRRNEASLLIQSCWRGTRSRLQSRDVLHKIALHHRLLIRNEAAAVVQATFRGHYFRLRNHRKTTKTVDEKVEGREGGLDPPKVPDNDKEVGVEAAEVNDGGWRQVRVSKEERMKWRMQSALDALARDDFKTLLSLIDQGVPVNTKVCENKTFLHLAVTRADVASVRSLIVMHADLNVLDSLSHRTPLHAAVGRRNIEMVRLLLHFAPKICEDITGCTPLDAACEDANCPLIVVQELLEDMKKRDSSPFPLDRLVHTASRTGNATLLAYLLDYDAKNADGDDKNSGLHRKKNKGTKVLITPDVPFGRDGDTPLHVAARHGRVTCVKFLLSRGANVHATNRLGITPLHCAVLSLNPTPSPFPSTPAASVRPLTTSSTLSSPTSALADTDHGHFEQTLKNNFKIQTQMHDIIQLLAKAGGDVNAKSQPLANLNPMAMAALTGNEFALRDLIALKANVNAPTNPRQEISSESRILKMLKIKRAPQLSIPYKPVARMLGGLGRNPPPAELEKLNSSLTPSNPFPPSAPSGFSATSTSTFASMTNPNVSHISSLFSTTTSTSPLSLSRISPMVLVDPSRVEWNDVSPITLDRQQALLPIPHVTTAFLSNSLSVPPELETINQLKSVLHYSKMANELCKSSSNSPRVGDRIHMSRAARHLQRLNHPLKPPGFSTTITMTFSPSSTSHVPHPFSGDFSQGEQAPHLSDLAAPWRLLEIHN